MTHYKDFQNSLMDRYDLAFSVYVAALDIQLACDLPYLWTFTFDLTGEVFFGRTWDDLLEFFKILEDVGRFTYDHKLLVYVNDFSQLYAYGRTIINFDAEPTVAKSPSDVLLLSYRGLEFRSFIKYTEKDIDIYIKLNNPSVEHIKPDIDGLSAQCELTEVELNYSALRVLEMTRAIRYDIDTIYQGQTRKVLLTKTKCIERLLRKYIQQDDPSGKLARQIYNQNPLTSDFGLKVLLPQLRKAFFGGTVFYEQGMLNKLIKHVKSADLVSAYCAEFILSEFPISKFKIMKPPKDWHELLYNYDYSEKALLIQFEARDVELKKGGLAILPAALKHYYIDTSSYEERRDAMKRSQTLKLKKSKVIRMCLTDIDFKLFLKYYKFDESTLKVHSVLGARYGYLPDYIIKTVAELYSNKMISKAKYNKLKAAGLADEIQKQLYKDDKSNVARLYGIFTQSPVVPKYKFNPEKHCLELETSEHLRLEQRFSPVIYQWGVWTTARVRQKLCMLRDAFRANGLKTISGDTDCINFTGQSTDIITRFNANIKQQVRQRCEAIGLDPAALKDLGELELDTYKYYRLTSAKQYAKVYDSDKGEIFETVCGGMDKECKYFEDYSLKQFGRIDPLKMIEHFRIGLVIPESASPRKITRQCSGLKRINFIDRDGNNIIGEVRSFQAEQSMRFSLCDPFSSIIFKDEPAALSDCELNVDEVLGNLAERVSHIATATPSH